MNLRRKLAAAFAAAAVAAGGGLAASVLTPSPADAHGASLFPGSRQFLCWQDGNVGGVPVADSPACQFALAEAGDGFPWFWNWFANLDPNGQGRTEDYIADGEICSGGNNGPFDFSMFNATRDDWPFTHVTAGATYQFQHNNWAPHPGRFDTYVTVNGWNPATPLSWDELELVHSTTGTVPQASGGPDGLGFYFWDVTLPADRVGKHVIFVHWVRSDSPENFYSCSDVAFDGGNGEVTFPGVGTTTPPPTETTPPPTETTPPPTETTPPPTETTPPPATGECTVDYNLVSSWAQGFQADVTVTNNGDAAINGWEVGWTFPAGQQIDQAWNGTVSQPGPAASVTNAAWNGNLAANGGSAAFGILGTPGGGADPTAFTLNGTACSVG